MKKISINEKYLKYLPSKKFAVMIGICLVIGIGFLFFSGANKQKFVGADGGKPGDLKVADMTIDELVKNDTDGDSIPDWEEALWGTDKNKAETFDGMTDEEYIKKKKEELNMPTDAENTDSTPHTETERFAHDFFSAYTALKDSGQVDSETINNFSNALGQSVIDPNIIDQYGINDIKVDQSGDESKKDAYYEAVVDLYDTEQSSGLGDELNIVSEMLAAYSSTGQETGSEKLGAIADAYQDFAKKLMALSAPISLSEYHLRIANSANNTGIAVRNMMKMTSDPVVGLAGLSQYQKYSADFMGAVGDLEKTLPGAATQSSPTGDASTQNSDIIQQ